MGETRKVVNVQCRPMKGCGAAWRCGGGPPSNPLCIRNKDPKGNSSTFSIISSEVNNSLKKLSEVSKSFVNFT